MRHNPAGDWTIADIQKVCSQLGWQCLAPSGGSHWKVTAPGSSAILTVPAKRPIKPVYIRKLVAMVDEVQNG
jgi:predicted RNA binding protein YcfA (HicA-like mRNA interferase family)